MEALLAAALGLIVGLSIGTLGGGGSVLAVPLLVYVLGEPVHDATTASLMVVAAAGVAGGVGQSRAGLVCWDCVLVISVAAAIGSLGGAALNTAASGDAILLAFVPVLAVAGAAIWRSGGAPEGDVAACPRVQVGPGALAGILVGFMIGFFGVGGGFLVVPLMVFALGFPLRRAVATSIVIVAIVSVASFGSHLLADGSLDIDATLAMALGAVFGALGGSVIGPSLPRIVLGRAFGVLVLTVAVWLLVSVFALGGPPAGMFNASLSEVCMPLR